MFNIQKIINIILLVIISIQVSLGKVIFSGQEQGNSMSQSTSTIYQYSVQDIDGQQVSFSTFKGKLLLIVNVASACGYTPQYKGLQKLYDTYKDKGLEVIGFPCNQFGKQESGSEQEIKEFAKSKYGITFPLMHKVDVNGAQEEPIFKYLKESFPGDIRWNFNKFLVGRDGKVLQRYGQGTSPEAITKDIESSLYI